MERSKKIGMITIAAALILAAAVVTLSTNPCRYDAPLTTVLLDCVRIDLPEYTWFDDYSQERHVLTKYLLLICSAFLALGFLWLKGALPAPGGSRLKEQTNSSAADVQ